MSELENLRAQLKELNAEYAKIKTLPPAERGEFGRTMNAQKTALLSKIAAAELAAESANVMPLDISAPCAPNEPLPEIKRGTKHPLMTELQRVIDIFKGVWLIVFHQ